MRILSGRFLMREWGWIILWWVRVLFRECLVFWLKGLGLWFLWWLCLFVDGVCEVDVIGGFGFCFLWMWIGVSWVMVMCIFWREFKGCFFDLEVCVFKWVGFLVFEIFWWWLVFFRVLCKVVVEWVLWNCGVKYWRYGDCLFLYVSFCWVF